MKEEIQSNVRNDDIEDVYCVTTTATHTETLNFAWIYMSLGQLVGRHEGGSDSPSVLGQGMERKFKNWLKRMSGYFR